jgi:hypothetical protein
MTTAAPHLQMVVGTDGTVCFIYSELLDLASLGQVQIDRASHVEPDEQGRWWADLSPVQGPVLGPFDLRSDAVAAEVGWLECHVINQI